MDTFIQKNGTIIAIINDVLPENILEQLEKWLENLDYKGKNSYEHVELDREQLWFHRDGTYFCTSWKKIYDRWKGNKYPPFLDMIQGKIIDKAKRTLNKYDIEYDLDKHNSCLINRYNDGSKYIRPHSDSEISFGKEPIIIGFSLGATRKLQFDSRYKPEQHMEFLLKNNSIFIMAGKSQIDWEHSIPKDDECDKPRYSMTIRHHLN